MADVARILPRLWDGQRALRFLLGLAMLALAFAANAGLIGSAGIAAPLAPAGDSTVAVPASAVGGLTANGAAATAGSSRIPAPAAGSTAIAAPEIDAPAAVVVAALPGVLPVAATILLGLLALGLAYAAAGPGAGRLAGRAWSPRGPPLA